MIKNCDCKREWCEYFDSSEGEYGGSYSKKELIEYLAELKDKVAGIEELLKETNNK